MSKSLKLYAGSALGAAIILTGAMNFADRNITPLPENAAVMGAASESPDTMFIAAATASGAEGEGPFGLGREALPEEIAAWDIDIRPDGKGLPEGRGNVWDGEGVFVEQCAVCHGDFGEGVGRWPVLTGGFDTLTDQRPVKTTGSYWPYLSTVWDYVHRAMPFGNAQSLTDDEVYAITAYLLNMNGLVDGDFELSHENFSEVTLPNEDGFYMDDRDELELPEFTRDPCMENCKESVEITMRAAVLDVTPDETVQTMEESGEDHGTDMAAADDGAATEAEADTAGDAATPALDMALVDEGEKVFRKCKACHQVGDGASHRVGPQLNGVMGRELGAAEDFRYSSTMEEMGEDGVVWTEETMAEFLAKPRSYVKGTKMSFPGLRSDEEIAAVTEYLKSFSQ